MINCKRHKILIRIFSFACCVMILSLSVGSKYFDSKNMMQVEAVGEIALGLDVMYALCEYIGSAFLGYSCASSMPELTSDDVAELGHSLSCAMFGFDSIFEPNDPIIGMLDSTGQQYVFGSEALKETAETSFTVIQGGKNNDDDDDNGEDDDSNIIHFPKNHGDIKKFFALSFTGASAIAKVFSDEYLKFANDDPESILQPFIIGHLENFTGYDSIPKDVNGNYIYSGTSVFVENQPNKNPWTATYTLQSPHRMVLADGFAYDIEDNFKSYRFNYDMTRSDGYHMSGTRAVWYWYGSTGVLSFSLNMNMPIYNTFDEAKAACVANDFSDALNYTQTYRNADWLQDDWTGELLDPLTGLNALSNWANIARHQGLNALGNDPVIDDMRDYLRDYFANLGTDTLPEVDPSLAPIKYPSTIPDTVIDPSKNPALIPSKDPIKPVDPSVPVDPDIPINPDIPIEDVIEIPVDDFIPAISESIGDLNVDLKDKFPFCIPWDLYYLLTFLSDLSGNGVGVSVYSDHGGGGHSRDPVEQKNGAPVFRLPIVIERYGIEEYIIVDMSPFEPLSRISRLLFTLMFVYTLINWTVKIVSVRKDD